MRFEVPQFIEVEDKIVGPLTWRQFIYVAGGIGIELLLFFSTPFLIFVMLGIPFGALAGFLAFRKVNNRPFSIFLESMFNYFRKHKLYLWRREEQQSIIEKTEPEIETPLFAPTPKTAPSEGKQTIQSLSNSLQYQQPDGEKE